MDSKRKLAVVNVASCPNRKIRRGVAEELAVGIVSKATDGQR
jgi:hypothetical protein